MVYINPRRAPMPRTAKLFFNGRSQAVRLPADLRLKAARCLSGKTKLPETWSCHGVRSHGTASSNAGDKQMFGMTSWQTVRMKSHRNASCSNWANEHDLLKMSC